MVHLGREEWLAGGLVECGVTLLLHNPREGGARMHIGLIVNQDVRYLHEWPR